MRMHAIPWRVIYGLATLAITCAVCAPPSARGAPDVTASADAGPRLVDASERLAGFHRPNGHHNAGGLAGLAWFDYDDDGRLDLFVRALSRWTARG